MNYLNAYIGGFFTMGGALTIIAIVEKLFHWNAFK